MVATVSQEFKEQAIRHLQVDFVPKIRHCLELLSEKQLWWRPNEHCNSCGNLVLHLCGNVRQWIMAGIAGQTDVRDRDFEFATREPVSCQQLLEKLEETVQEATAVIAGLDETRLLRQHHIQIYQVSALQAVFHVVEHFSYHTGQILYVTKMLEDLDLGFYADLQTKRFEGEQA